MLLTRRTFLALSGACSLSLAGRTMAQAPLNLRMSITATEADPLFAAAQRFAQLVGQRTNGRIAIVPFPGTQIGGEQQQFEALKLGTTQIAAVGLNGSDAFLAMFLPYVFRDMEHQGRVIDGSIAQPWKDELLTKHRVHFFGHAYQNPRQLTANRPVRTPSDVAGLKIRVPQLPALLETWKALGAIPTPMGVTEVFMALQQRVVDAQENPIEQIINNSFYEVQKYLVLLNYSRPVISVMANDAAWQRISAPDRQIMTDTWREARESHKSELQASERDRIEFVRSKGVEVINPDVAAFKEATAKVAQTLGEKAWGSGTYDRIVGTA
jgi:tripartite ATP-independent transporter DctP family solute receptor